MRRTPAAAWSLLALLAACDHDFADPSRALGPPLEEGREYPVVVHEPQGTGVLHEALAVADGSRELPSGTACSACHGPVPPTELAATKAAAAGSGSTSAPTFHASTTIDHGGLSCGQCHDPSDRSQLHLADDTPVPFVDVIALCSQCHGSQRRDFDHGAHGGMSGHWDLNRGPRLRNTCVDCHAPHAPDYPVALPVFPPRDRYLRSE